MKRHGDLWKQIITPENVELAYRRARRGKSTLRSVRKFANKERRNLRKIRASLVDKTFTTSPYLEKIILFPKKRTIYVLPFSPDRIVQHCLMNVVEPIWDKLLLNCTHACRKNKGVHTGSEQTMQLVRKYRYCLKCDISKFYPSINQNILFDIVNRKIKCKDTLWLLENIIFSYPGGTNVPIGNYTSQWFGNLYMDKVDRWAVQELQVPGYVRYCDDFLFFSDDKRTLSVIQNELPFYLQERLCLRLSKCDLFPVSRGVDFLGYRYFPRYKLLRRSVVTRMRRRLLRVYEALKSGVDPQKYMSVIASAYGWMAWANTRNLFRSLKMPYLIRKVEIDVTR